MSDKDGTLRKLPSVDALLAETEAESLAGRYGRGQTAAAIRRTLDALRASILGNSESAAGHDLEKRAILARAGAFLAEKFAPTLRPAVNATGVLMHSGLGRAVLSEEAGRALADVARGYSTLALEVETGRRGQRDVHVAALLRELTGAEAATVVNNNAAATVLILNTLAKGREVLISRGQLVEIGGSFRMPEVMALSGAVLREVGTTNKTHLRDYAEAIGPATGAILRVHHSNYRILGFTSEPGVEELVALGAKHGLPVIDDLGSGALVDLKAYGLAAEPLVRASVAAGVSCACFSGDKLIGGPQSGLIVGKAEVIQRVKKNPFARAFRCGKLTLAAMEATLTLFLSPEKLEERHPVYRMLSLSPEEAGRRAERVAKALSPTLHFPDFEITVVDGESQVGSGAVPVETIPTRLLSLRVRGSSPDDLGKKLRLQKPAVFTRIHDGAVLFDFRTIQPEEDSLVEAAIIALFR
ncbi:MAG: L-seryl-tRNA(Sec) selenium transferase [Candidatus Aminicenantes bacterium]|nr:L-seryl-tRNA(Sec) selenium transferase [Candidatus Aminicenantes bacterium]